MKREKPVIIEVAQLISRVENTRDPYPAQTIDEILAILSLAFDSPIEREQINFVTKEGGLRKLVKAIRRKSKAIDRPLTSKADSILRMAHQYRVRE